MDFAPSRLQIALLFSGHDLTENRAGRITYGQRQRILWSTAYYPIGAVLALGLMALFEWKLLEAGIYAYYAQPMAFFFGIVVALALLGAWRPHVMDALFGPVDKIEGDLVRRSTMGIFRRIHYVRIGPRAFDLPKWAADEFSQEPWCCYYLPRTGRLLSAEKISQP
ncbi:MAG TPA: hypothetical protein VF160_00935 [Candidatus Dormibacteraeota bacterium]